MTRIDDIKACQRIIGTTADGAFGNRSVDALIGYFRAKGLLNDPAAVRNAPALIRADIVATALREVCALPADNADPDKYWATTCPEFLGKPHSIAWCGAFALWCFQTAVPACKNWTWKPGVGFVFRYGMRIVSLPEPGDLVYWEYLNGRKIDHYAIVRDVRDGIVYSIDGNQGIAPRERVEERDRSIVHTKPVFFSIGAFL